MALISKIDPLTASDEVRRAIDRHVAQGHRVTNEKLTLLHNVTCFEALEAQSYAVDRELARLIGQQAADFFEYAISLQNDCLVCSTYFGKLLRKYGVTDFEAFAFTEEEELVIAFGRAMAKDPKGIPKELIEALLNRFGEETVVVLTTMGVFMIANNCFNDVLQVDAEP